jgi:hypothetical protein
MADPISIIGAVGAIASIIDVVGKSIKCINDLRDHWKEADLTFLSLVSQLTALRLALVKIQEWVDNSQEDAHHQLVMDLNSCISYCQLLVSKLDILVGQLNETTQGPLELSSKVKLLFGSRDVEHVQKLIERQTGVLTLLLTACGKTISEQKVLLEKPKTRKAFGQVKTDSESLWVLRDTDSLRSRFSDNLSKLSLTFDFDNTLFSSKVYVRILRGSIKGVLRQQQHSASGSQPQASKPGLKGPPAPAMNVPGTDAEVAQESAENSSYELAGESQPTKKSLNVLFLGRDEIEKKNVFETIRIDWKSEGYNAEKVDNSGLLHLVNLPKISKALTMTENDRDIHLFDVLGQSPTLAEMPLHFHGINAVAYVFDLTNSVSTVGFGPDVHLRLNLKVDLPLFGSVFQRSTPIILFILNEWEALGEAVEVSPLKSSGQDIIDGGSVRDYILDCVNRVKDHSAPLYVYSDRKTESSTGRFLLDALNDIEVKEELAHQRELMNKRRSEELSKTAEQFSPGLGDHETFAQELPQIL